MDKILVLLFFARSEQSIERRILWVCDKTLLLNSALFRFQVPNEQARLDDLHLYSGSDVIITLPGTTTVYDVNYLAVFNNEVKVS